MDHTDVAVIGGGLLGCFTARALTAYQLRVTVLEAREDVCTGISRANTGIVYTGCDTKPGTLKTRLCVRANRDFDRLCQELDVPFSRCGSLMAAFGPRGAAVLEKKLRQGRTNGVPGLALLGPEEVYAREPHLAPGVRLGLYAPGTGTVIPWELGAAAFESARSNGAVFRFSEEVLRMERTSSGYRLDTSRGSWAARAVVNCAGLRADAVREMTKLPAVRIFPTAGDYLVLDSPAAGFVRHILFHEPEERGKGLTLTPATDGSLLVGPTERDTVSGRAVSREGLDTLYRLCAQVVPDLPLGGGGRSSGASPPCGPTPARCGSGRACGCRRTGPSPGLPSWRRTGSSACWASRPPGSPAPSPWGSTRRPSRPGSWGARAGIPAMIPAGGASAGCAGWMRRRGAP